MSINQIINDAYVACSLALFGCTWRPMFLMISFTVPGKLIMSVDIFVNASALLL